MNELKKEINQNYKNKAIIKFAVFPFAIAVYIIQGKRSKDFNNVKKYFFKIERGF